MLPTQYFIPYFRNGLELEAFFIGNRRRKMCSSTLAALPEFIRFGRVRLYYYYGSQLITQKCQAIINYLLPLKRRLGNSNLISIFATIDQRRECCFADCSLLSHLRNELLPICDSADRYEFNIDFVLEVDAASDVIAKILQIAQISRCANVEFFFYYSDQSATDKQTKLPVLAISNWLHIKADVVVESIGQNQRDRYLQIATEQIQNANEMCEELEQVIFNFVKYNSDYLL